MSTQANARLQYPNPKRKQGIVVGSSLTRRVTIAWHARPARESIGETPMPLSNPPSHNPLNQRAGKRGVISQIPHLPAFCFNGNPKRKRGASCNPSLTYRVIIGSLPIVPAHLCWLRST